MGVFDISKKEFKVRLTVQEPGKSAEFIHDRVIAMDWGDAKKVLKARYPFFKALLDCTEIKSDAPANSRSRDTGESNSNDGSARMHWPYGLIFGIWMGFGFAVGFFPFLYFKGYRTFCARLSGYW